MPEKERFEKLKGQGGKLGGMSSYEILYDKYTGVEYLYLYNSGNGSVAVTPIVGRDGKPYLDPALREPDWFGKVE